MVRPRFFAAAILSVLAAQTPAPSAPGETIELSPRTHREVWKPSSDCGRVIIEWTTKPTVRVEDNDVKVTIKHGAELHLEAPVVEKTPDFGDIHHSITSVWLFLANGQLVQHDSTEISVGKQQVLTIATFHACAGRQWGHEWRVKKQDLPIEQAMSLADSAVSAAGDKPRSARLLVTRLVLDTMQPHGSAAPEYAQANAVLEQMIERETLVDDPKFATILDKIRTAVDKATREEGWRELREEIFERAGHFAKLLARGELSAEDAARLTNIVKYGSQAIDDLEKPFPAESSSLTNFLKIAYGITTMADNVKDPDAKEIVDALRDLLDQAPGMDKNPLTGVMDVPAEVAASMLDVTREGFDEAAGALEGIGGAIGGDPEGVEKALTHAEKLQQVLSGENYGRAMLDAIGGRIVEKVPFLRAIVAWFAE